MNPPRFVVSRYLRVSVSNCKSLIFGALLVCLLLTSSCGEIVYVTGLYSGELDSKVTAFLGSDLRTIVATAVIPNAHSIAANLGYLWVTHPHRLGTFDNGYISILNPLSLAVVEELDLGDLDPRGIAFSPDGSRAYVSSTITGELAVFDTTTYGLLSTVLAGNRPDVILVTPDGAKLYVLNNQAPAGVTVIQASDLAILTHLPLEGNFLREAVMSPDGSRAYLVNPRNDRVEVIRTSDDTLLNPIPVGPYPGAISISPDGSYLFIGYRVTDEVDMVRLSDGAIVSTAVVPDLFDARRIVAQSDGRRIYLTDHADDGVYALDVAGEHLAFAAVADVGAVSGVDPRPIGIELLELGLRPREDHE